MPSTLARIATALCLGLLAACAITDTEAPSDLLAPVEPLVVMDPSIQRWLDLQQQVASMPIEDIKTQLEGAPYPDDTSEMFYFGLLNQHSQDYEGWIRARDAFRVLHNDERLSPERRQMAALLEMVNQKRINWYQRYMDLLAVNDELQRKLEKSEEEKDLLQKKIDALTELEAQISTRKDQ